ncbi:MAG TPA: zinc dependent phospholipase C family protein [Armatimonadota bacterium]|jgi:hypothetical protein
MKRWVTFALLLTLVLSARPGLAWGVKGHTWITENAVALLPAGPLQTYVDLNAREIVEDALAPDLQWKDGTVGILEGPNHYLDLEAVTPQLNPADLPRYREEAARLFTTRGLAYNQSGFLPWRIVEMYQGLVNAFRDDPRNIALYAGALAHYVGDATQPLHVTVDFDGRAGQRVGGRKYLQGIHSDYETGFLGGANLEFQQSSLALATAPQPVADPCAAAVATIFESHKLVDPLYAIVGAAQGPDRYQQWAPELAQLTRTQLAKAGSLLASLWLTAWQEAGSPALTPAAGRS